MPYSYRIASNQNSPKFNLYDTFTISITNTDDGSVAIFTRIVSKVGKQVSFKNHLNEFICSRKPKTFVGNIEGIQLPFHLSTGVTFGLWVYSGPTATEPTAPARQERIREAEEAVARTEERVREAQESLARVMEMERVEEARIEAIREATARRVVAEYRPTVPAHFLAEFMEMSLQLKRGHSCPCCLDNVTKETIYLSRCGHIMCKDCRSRVISRTNLCPTCRQEL